MLYFLITTGKCNLKCPYCGGSFPEDVVAVRNLLLKYLRDVGASPFHPEGPMIGDES
jgi:transposase